MPVDVLWDNDEKTIIRQSYSGRVTIQDYYTSTDKFVELAQSVSHTVHSIMDRSDIVMSQGAYVRVMRYANERMPDNIGIRVIIHANVMTKMMINIGSRIAPRLISNVHLADSLDEARTIIATRRADSS